MGQTALQELTSSANATSGESYVFGGINSGEAPLADYFSTGVDAKSAVAQAFETTFGVFADRSRRGEHHRLADAELSFRTVRGACSPARLDLGLVVGLEHKHQRRKSRRARP